MLNPDLKYHTLQNGLALRLYQLNNGKYAVALWDIDADRCAMMTCYGSIDQAEKAFTANVSDCERYQ